MMSVTSPRRFRRNRFHPAIEILESRALLAAHFTAVADTYDVIPGQTFNMFTPWNELHTEVDNYHAPDSRRWLDRDGPLRAVSLRPGTVRIHAEAMFGEMYWIIEFSTVNGQPLTPGSYVANTEATAPGIQAVVTLTESGTGGASGPTPAQFTIYAADFAADGTTVNRFDADFVIGDVAAGSVHYSNGPWGLLANDSAYSPVGLTASLVTGPAHGSLSLNPDGTFSYTPDPGFAGTDTFTYTASDGATTSAPATVTLHVLATNLPLSFTKGPDITIAEDAGPQSVDNWATNISPKLYPEQSLAFVAYYNTNPPLFEQGPSIDPAGKLTFTPAADAYGTATITFGLRDTSGAINDGQKPSAYQTFTITVTPVNDAPVLQDRALSLVQGQTTGSFIAWSDDSTAVTFTVATPPAHGSLSLNPDGSFTYTAAADFVGSDSFQVLGSDGALTGGPATVTLNVLPGPRLSFSGVVLDVYAQPNDAFLTPLAGRTVFEDVNGNGQLDAGEPTAVTGIDGQYFFSLPAGAHTFRVVPKAGWITPKGFAPAATIDSAVGGFGVLHTTMADPVVIDVLAVHPDPVSIYDAFLPWGSAIRNAFAAANAIFANSDTNVRLNLLAIDSVKYVPADNLNLDLVRLATFGDGALDAVVKRRNALKADLVILFEARPDAAGKGGLAYVLDRGRPDASRGYAVVVADQDARLGGQILAHEIGHTLGADHDPDHGPKNNVPYARGYRFIGNDNVLYRDVMAYEPGWALPFFSSPRLSYGGLALGDAATADNARVIRENAYIVASYRGAKVSAPVSLTAVAATVAKSAAKPGETLTAKATVRNDGVSKFNGKFAVAFYLSKDRTLDSSDRLLKRTSVTARNVAAKGTVAASAAFKVGAKLPAGTYYVLAVATATGRAADELTAKSKAASLKVGAPPKKSGAKAKPVAAAFQAARPIAAAIPANGLRHDDRDDVITGMLGSPR